MTSALRVTPSGLLSAGVDVAPAGLYALFAWAHWLSFCVAPRLSLVLIVLVETLIACFILVRRSTKEASRSPWDWTLTVAGTLAPFLLRPTWAMNDLTGGELVQVGGILLATAAAASLNRSIGLVPAYREVKTRGVYRLIRHPLYCGYTIGNIGYLVSNFTAWNTLVVVGAFALQVLRIESEERYLSGYPDYRAYQARTPWRLLPFLY